jgi:hypothetical protein
MFRIVWIIWLATMLPCCCSQETARSGSTEITDSERPKVPGEHPMVDLGLWAGKTYQDMDRLFSEFSQADPPVVGPYGICSKITFIFQAKARDAKIATLLCDLDQQFAPEEALRLLGFSSGKPAERNGSELSFHPLNEKVRLVNCRISHAEKMLTNYVEVIYY